MPTLNSSTNPITANGTYHFRVNQAGRYRVVIGSKALVDSAGVVETDSAGAVGGRAFSGGNVTVQQDGIAYTNMSAATAPVVKELVLGEGDLKFIVAGATGTPSIGIKIEPINGPA